MKNGIEKKKRIATRCDSIIEARFSLTARQNNILDMLFVEIQNDEKYTYELSVEKFKDLYHIDTSNIYRDLEKGAKSFEGLGFHVLDKETNELIYYPWFSKIWYRKKHGKIVVNIDRDLKKLLYETKKKIFYDIEYPLNFSSSYSQRFYYYLKSYEDTGWRKDTIENLLLKLDCPKTYENFANFKKYVLEVAKNEINSSSDILFDYNPIKTGRKVTHIDFNINKKNDLKNPEINVFALDVNIDNIDGNFISCISKMDFSQSQIDDIMSACNYGFNNQTDEDNKEYKIRKYFIDKHDIAIKYFKKQNEDGEFIRILIAALKGDWNNQPKSKKKTVKNQEGKQLRFDNFQAREYDYDDLERKLLGWE